jgi:hypothetical protein
LGDNGQIEALIWRMQGTTQYDSSFDNEADFVQQVMALKTNYAINDQWLLNLNVGHSSDESDHFGNQATTSFLTRNEPVLLYSVIGFYPMSEFLP